MTIVRSGDRKVYILKNIFCQKYYHRIWYKNVCCHQINKMHDTVIDEILFFEKFASHLLTGYTLLCPDMNEWCNSSGLIFKCGRISRSIFARSIWWQQIALIVEKDGVLHSMLLLTWFWLFPIHIGAQEQRWSINENQLKYLFQELLIVVGKPYNKVEFMIGIICQSF